MKFISENKISKNQVNFLNEKMIFQHAKSIEQDNFIKPLNLLKNLYLQRGLNFKRPELNSYYIHCLN
tara:strand:- start:600 stop:800 length:201 start_codon:yes stop_codon:yes gene_type:complete